MAKRKYLHDSLIGGSIFILLIEFFSNFNWVSKLLPPFHSIVYRMLDEATHLPFWWDIYLTLFPWAVGLILSMLIGIPLGLLIGLTKTGYLVTEYTIDAIRPIPMMAGFPLLILTLGTGYKLGIFIVFISAFWPLLIQAIYAVQDVDPRAKETAKIYGLNSIQIFRHVIIPSSLPYIATGVRIAGTIALIVAVAVTLLTSDRGLGGVIAAAQGVGDLSLMYAYVLASGLIGLLISIFLSYIEHRLFDWRQENGVSR